MDYSPTASPRAPKAWPLVAPRLVCTDITSSSEIGSKNLMVAAVIGSFGPVNAQAWYLDHQDTFDAIYAKVDGKVGPVSAYAQYSELDLDEISGEEIELLKVGVSANVGMFNAGITYARGGDEGTGILNAVSANSAIGYSVTASGKLDAKAYFVDLGAQVTDKLHVGLNYDVVKSGDEYYDGEKLKHKETYVQVTYNHAKNLSAYVRLAKGENEYTSASYDADGDKDNGDYTRGRLQVEYKF